MSKQNRPVDGRMIVRDRANDDGRPRWKPSPLACWFFAIVAFDALILLVASGVGSSGNDAAGNGMTDGFREAFVQAGAVLTGCLALLFVVVRHKGTRIGLVATLALVTLLQTMLLQ